MVKPALQAVPAGPCFSFPDLVQVLPDAVVVFDAGLGILFANDAALGLFGRAVALGDIFPGQSPVLDAALRVVGAGSAVTLHDIAAGGHRARRVHVAPAGDVFMLVFSPDTLPSRSAWTEKMRHALRPAQLMARTLAHEIKNPLAGIRAAAELLARGSMSDDDRELLGLISRETERILRLVRKVDVFGETPAESFVPVNIHAVLGHVVRMAKTTWPGAEVAEVYDPSLPELRGDFDSLVQAAMNLVRNAAEALPDGRGKIILRTRYDSAAPWHPDSREKLPLCLEVEDNGCGMTPGTLKNIFDPYYTTKAAGEGLGLAVVSKVVDDHGGAIEVASAPGKTVFRLNFPVGRKE